MARPSIAALTALVLLAAGCGESSVSPGATVSVYVAASLCAEAQREVERPARDDADLKVRVVCSKTEGAHGGVDLAAAGAGARRATEDSTSVAFLEAPGPAAAFTQSIVEAAEIAWVEAGSGSSGMRRLLDALEERGSASPREAVLEQVG